MRKLFALVPLAALALAAQTAAPKKAAAVAVPAYKDLKYPALKPIPVPTVETFTLPNGLRVYLLEDHELPVISGVARVRTGNLFDPAGKVGLATMTGMAMRTGGTHAKTGEELDSALEDVAASVEAGIGESSGSVNFTALKENAPAVLAIFHDVLTAPEFRQEKIDLAKTQLHSGIARRNDEPSAIADREFAALVYGRDSSYGWLMQHATIDAISRADLQAFYQRYFFPANALLAVWGDFDSAQMKAQLTALFADWTVEQAPVPAFPKVTAKPAPGTYLATKRDTGQTYFVMGHLGGVFNDKDYPALEILSDILGGGFQSRLFQQVRTKMGNAYSVGASWGAEYDHPGLLEISAGTKGFSTVETIRAVQKEVERIRTAEVTEDELKVAKDSALNSLVFAFDTRAKTLGRMLTYEYFGYPKDFIQQYQKALGEVTRADILRVAKEHFSPENFTLVAVGNPEVFDEPLDKLGKPVTAIDLTIPAASKPAAAAKANPAADDDAKAALQRAQQAAGGADQLAAIHDYRQESEFVLVPQAGGLHVKEVDRWVAPDYFRQDSDVPAGKISAYFNGVEGWISTPQGEGPLADAQLNQVRGDLFRLYFRLLLSDRLPGRTVASAETGGIEITLPGGETARVEFDKDTGLPHTLSYEAVHVTGPAMEVEETLSDFRDVNGIKVPFQITIAQGGQKFADVQVKDVKINSGIKVEELGQHPAQAVKQ